MDVQKLPFRIGVGIIVLNNKNQVFVGKRKDNPGNNWQMPQGGIDEGEDFISAMKRIIWKGKFRGQKQKWFITRFLGKDTEINLKTKHPEFIEWKWIEPEKLPEVIVYFKKEIYLSLVKEIKLLIE